MEKQSLFIESQTAHMVKITSSNMWYIHRSALRHTVDEAYSIHHAVSMQGHHISQDGRHSAQGGHSAQISPGIPRCFGPSIRCSEARSAVLPNKETLDQCTL